MRIDQEIRGAGSTPLKVTGWSLAKGKDIPFFGRIDQNNARLHTVRIDTFDVFLEVFELLHRLQ